jgi:hypothetical protein
MAAAKRRFSEGKALDAVLRRIEEREMRQRGNDGRSPEEQRHPWPIDYACTLGGQLFAIEHTGIFWFPSKALRHDLYYASR